MKHYYYNFLVIFMMCWGYLSSETDEEIADKRNSLILVSEGKQLRLPTCMVFDTEKNSYSFKRNKRQKEYIFCPPKIDLDNEYKHCLFSDGNNTGPNTCEKRVEPIIIAPKSKKDQPLKCLENRGTVFHFGFRTCKWHEKGHTRTGGVDLLPFQIVYTICYQELKQQVLQISHKMYSPNMRTNAFLSPERRITYNIDKNDFDLFKKHFDELPETYQKELDESHLEMVFVVPPENMAFSVSKRAVYHYINTQLVLKQTASILKYVNEFLQQRAIEHLGEIRITDGFERSPAGDITVWWKIIFSESENSAMIIIIHNTTVQPTLDQKYCITKSVCEKYGWFEVIPEDKKLFAYCCRPQKIVASLGYKPVRFTLNLKKKWYKFYPSHHRELRLC